jgi:hypothetical protein
MKLIFFFRTISSSFQHQGKNMICIIHYTRTASYLYPTDKKNKKWASFSFRMMTMLIILSLFKLQKIPIISKARICR